MISTIHLKILTASKISIDKLIPKAMQTCVNQTIRSHVEITCNVILGIQLMPMITYIDHYKCNSTCMQLM